MRDITRYVLEKNALFGTVSGHAGGLTPRLSKWRRRVNTAGKAIGKSGIGAAILAPGALYAKSIYNRLDQDQLSSNNENKIRGSVLGNNVGYFKQNQLSAFRNNGIS